MDIGRQQRPRLLNSTQLNSTSRGKMESRGLTPVSQKTADLLYILKRLSDIHNFGTLYAEGPG